MADLMMAEIPHDYVKEGIRFLITELEPDDAGEVTVYFYGELKAPALDIITYADEDEFEQAMRDEYGVDAEDWVEWDGPDIR